MCVCVGGGGKGGGLFFLKAFSKGVQNESGCLCLSEEGGFKFD